MGAPALDTESLEYRCWHEVGHATACLCLGGSVELLELMEVDDAQGLARARCSTTESIRSSVACGGFAAEFFLLRTGRLGQVDEKAIAQIIFRNATKDREMYFRKSLLKDEEFTQEEDREFMSHAISEVSPLFKDRVQGMEAAVAELLASGKLTGERFREILFAA